MIDHQLSLLLSRKLIELFAGLSIQRQWFLNQNMQVLVERSRDQLEVGRGRGCDRNRCQLW